MFSGVAEVGKQEKFFSAIFAVCFQISLIKYVRPAFDVKVARF